MSNSNEDHVESNDEDDEEVRTPKLKNWQLRRLASALKIGRRKTSIKSLAAELGLDRDLVLELLRDPPPNLLLMSASLPDKVVPTLLEPEKSTVSFPPTTLSEEPEISTIEPKVIKAPVHVMRGKWAMQKRLKKVQVEILEKVYARTKRPTRTMISSIVHVTNLPWKKVVKWFEDKHIEDGVPDKRFPYQRSVPETISTN
ncbi:hypothetical protein QJS10_CPA10g00393 [Acorus calamus]|uniref:Homeobox domain-containing protein n=1 Tax=Acorus calamus TaxID=4465 RepID=A0AAV9E2Z2_ACOCL|nr:hypothetical protein QJS10_CPA10g00393 [Acorus calamus]